MSFVFEANYVLLVHIYEQINLSDRRLEIIPREALSTIVTVDVTVTRRYKF